MFSRGIYAGDHHRRETAAKPNSENQLYIERLICTCRDRFAECNHHPPAVLSYIGRDSAASKSNRRPGRESYPNTKIPGLHR